MHEMVLNKLRNCKLIYYLYLITFNVCAEELHSTLLMIPHHSLCTYTVILY